MPSRILRHDGIKSAVDAEPEDHDLDLHAAVTSARTGGPHVYTPNFAICLAGTLPSRATLCVLVFGPIGARVGGRNHEFKWSDFTK